jgi:hypothetical protein
MIKGIANPSQSAGVLYTWALYVPPAACSFITTVSITGLSGQHFVPPSNFHLQFSHHFSKWVASGGSIAVRRSFWVNIFKRRTEEQSVSCEHSFLSPFTVVNTLQTRDGPFIRMYPLCNYVTTIYRTQRWRGPAERLPYFSGLWTDRPNNSVGSIRHSSLIWSHERTSIYFWYVVSAMWYLLRKHLASSNCVTLPDHDHVLRDYFLRS